MRRRTPPTGTTHPAGRSWSAAGVARAGGRSGASATGTARPSTLDDDTITVGSFDFAESVVLAEVYSQALEAAGFDVERAFALGPREFVAPALVAGLVELVPEYAGTAAAFHSRRRRRARRRRHRDARSARGGARRHPIVVLAPAPAEDANTFVVTRTTADRLGVATLSDLAHVARRAHARRTTRVPDSTAVPRRPRRRLRAVLRPVHRARRRRAGHPAGVRERSRRRRPAVHHRSVLDDPDLVELADDRGLQPAENVTPLVRAEVVDRWGAGDPTSSTHVSARLTTAGVRG